MTILRWWTLQGLIRVYAMDTPAESSVTFVGFAALRSECSGTAEWRDHKVTSRY